MSNPNPNPSFPTPTPPPPTPTELAMERLWAKHIRRMDTAVSRFNRAYTRSMETYRRQLHELLHKKGGNR